MREELQKVAGVRMRFNGVVVRFGEKPAFKGRPLKTMLVQDVRSVATGRRMTDHLWFIVRKTFEALNLEPGDAIEFDAMATPYKKGYRGHRDDPELPPPSVDYRLSFPTKVRKIHGTAPTVDEAVARTIGPMPTVQESLFA